MPVLTNRFVKDLYFSVIFILCVYAITHNPITNPKPQPIPGNWSIQLMQHPLVFGLAGHNYLVLRNQDNEIMSELHGLATDSTTGQWKYVGANKKDVLKVWEFDGPRYYLAEKKYSGFILTEGKQGDMISLWEKARNCKDPINKKDIPYPPFGVKLNGNTENSNSVAYTLAICIGIDINHLGLVTPGAKNNLLDNQ